MYMVASCTTQWAEFMMKMEIIIDSLFPFEKHVCGSANHSDSKMID